MNLKISTESLKTVVAKVSKGAGNLSMLTITSCLTIETIDEDVVFTTTTNSRNLEVRIKGIVNSDNKFFACTDCDLFTKLVSKTDVDNVTLEVTENALVFHGNGVYNLPLIQDEEGSMVRIPPIMVDSMEEVEVSTEQLKQMLTWNKLCVAKTLEEPIFTGYCVKDNRVFTYDNNSACVSNIKLPKVNMLIPSGVVDLFSLFEDKSVKVKTTNNKVSFTSPDVTITGALLEGFDLYPTEQLSELAESKEFSSSIKVSRDKLSGLIDRMSLFATDDKNTISVSFSSDKLIISDSDRSAGEQISYISKTDAKPFEVNVDLRDVKKIISEVTTDEVNILYGSDIGLCIYSDTARYIVPLVGEDEE